jgi:Fe-S cluster assembly iron-binding protein IscA
MNTELLKEKYIKYNLTKDDVFKHQHFLIITRSGIDKIQALEGITIDYDVINCERNFCVVKANARKDGAFIQTFGSALKGQSFKDGNCNTWYVMEMAEKRAMSRAVLKLCGFYELGVFGEDESEDFKKNNNMKLTINNK